MIIVANCCGLCTLHRAQAVVDTQDIRAKFDKTQAILRVTLQVSASALRLSTELLHPVVDPLHHCLDGQRRSFQSMLAGAARAKVPTPRSPRTNPHARGQARPVWGEQCRRRPRRTLRRLERCLVGAVGALGNVAHELHFFHVVP